MTAVAQWHTCCRLAATEVQGSVFMRRMLHRREISSLMRAVTKWLLRTLTAGAPPILFADFHINFVGRLLGNHRRAAVYFGIGLVGHAINLL